MTTNSEIDVMTTIDVALNTIDPEAKVRVLNWVNSKHLGASSPTPKPAYSLEQKAVQQHSSPSKNKSAKSKLPKKSKNIIKQVKELNLHPTGKKSALDFVAEKQPNYKATPLFLNVLTPTPQVGDYVEADLLLGKAGVPVTDLHGFTADIAFDPQSINEQSLVCDFYATSWMTHNSPTLRLSKKPMDGKLYLGYVRTNGSAASGFGKVAKLGFIIEDDIYGVRDTDGQYYATISIKNGKVMGSDGEVYDMPEQTFEIPISAKKKSAFDANSIFVSPNPTSDVLNVNLNNSDDSNEYSIINLNGQTVANGTINKRSAQLNVSNLQTGLYFLRVVTANGVATKKFEVIK